MYDIFYTQCMMKKICPKSEFVCGFSSSSAAVEAGHCCVARSRGRVSVVEGAGSRALGDFEGAHARFVHPGRDGPRCRRRSRSLGRGWRPEHNATKSTNFQ